MAQIVFDTYGKTGVRLTCVERSGSVHQLREIAVQILFYGDFEKSFTAADNSAILPTDTMKNMVYVMASQKPIVSIELFAGDLAHHFLSQVSALTRVEIQVEETPWQRIGNHDAAFIQTGKERRTACCKAARTNETYSGGIEGLQILKTGDSAFSGFLKDQFTSLQETDDRLLGTLLSAEWQYMEGIHDFNTCYDAIRSAILDLFATHRSKSVQHTLFDMAEAILAGFPAILEIHLTMPNKHCLLVNLAQFGLTNPNRLFVPIDEPSGYIEARVRR